MKKIFLIACIFLFFGFSPKKQKNTHDYHIAIAEMQWNAETKSWQIILKVFTDDLEDALKKQEGKKIAVETQKKAPNIALKKYIATHFSFENHSPNLIGVELQNDMYWVYVECETKNAFKFKNFMFNAFFELFDDQLNMLNVKYKDKKKTFLYQKGKNNQNISF